METYIYCFIRKDLPKVHQIIQMSHACHEAGKWFEEPNPKMELDQPSNMVLFQVKNEEELRLIDEYLFNSNIECHIFRESNFNNEYTAICTISIDENDPKRELFKDFKLYK